MLVGYVERYGGNSSEIQPRTEAESEYITVAFEQRN
jgi:hypothetical protein